MEQNSKWKSLNIFPKKKNAFRTPGSGIERHKKKKITNSFLLFVITNHTYMGNVASSPGKLIGRIEESRNWWID